MSCCMLNNKPVSLCKGQNLGETSPSSGVRKNAMSPCSVQNGVSPDYVSKESLQLMFLKWSWRRSSLSLDKFGSAIRLLIKYESPWKSAIKTEGYLKMLTV